MTHQEYWAKREEEALKHYITEEAAYDKEVKRIYADMLDNCTEQINAFYGKYAAKENITLAEAKKRVSKLDIAAYERKAERYVKDREFSKQANEEMRLYNAAMRINRLEMLKANIGLELITGHDELDKFMGGVLKGRTEAELKRQAGILGKTITNNAETVHAIVNASFHNATFSDRVWMYQDLMKAELSKLLQSGLIAGKNPRELSRELQKQFDVSTKNAERLMRTELARVQTEAQKQSFERNGFEEYTYLANSSCCDACQALDGKHFKVADMMPGENAAPLHPNCRCSVAAYSDRKEYDEWLDFLEKGGTTEEFNKIKLTKNVSRGKITSQKELFKKASEARKGFKFISDKQFNDLTIEARKNGASIMRGTEEVEKHLAKMGATASTFGDVLLFKKDVCISEVLEETHHFKQNRAGMNNDKKEPLRTYLNEIDAKQYILDNAAQYKVPRNEIELIQTELEYYKKQLSDYKGGD